MAIEYKNASITLSGSYDSVLTVPAGKQAIISSVLCNNSYEPGAIQFAMRKLSTDNTPTDIVSNISINYGASTQLLAGKLVLTAGEKLQIRSVYDSYGGFRTSTNLIFNSWASIGLSGAEVMSMDQDNSGNIVVTGSNSMLARSTDGGYTWTKLNPAGTSGVTFNHIAYINNIWIAVGYSSVTGATIITSSNGITWTNISHGLTIGTQLNRVRYLNGAYYICGRTSSTNYPRIWRSTNAVTWTEVFSSLSANAACYDIAYNGTTYLAINSSFTDDQQMLISSDGITWSAHETTAFLGTGYAAAQIWTEGNTFWLAISGPSSTWTFYDIKTSTDAVTWTSSSDPAIIYGKSSQNSSTHYLTTTMNSCHVANNTRYFFTGQAQGRIYYTTNNGSTWSYRPGFYYAPNSLIYNSISNKILVCGMNGGTAASIYAFNATDIPAGRNAIGAAIASYVEVTP